MVKVSAVPIGRRHATHANHEIERPLQAEETPLGPVLGIALIHVVLRCRLDWLERLLELDLEALDEELGRCEGVLIRSGVGERGRVRAQDGRTLRI